MRTVRVRRGFIHAQPDCIPEGFVWQTTNRQQIATLALVGQSCGFAHNLGGAAARPYRADFSRASGDNSRRNS
jgi:hypothetical protein